MSKKVYQASRYVLFPSLICRFLMELWNKNHFNWSIESSFVSRSFIICGSLANYKVCLPSISSRFYARVFHTKARFLRQNFEQKKNARVKRKILIKLSPVLKNLVSRTRLFFNTVHTNRQNCGCYCYRLMSLAGHLYV